MKRILLALVMFMGFSFAAQAQISQSSWMVGGTAGFNSDPTAINLSPRLGYFLIDNLAVGASFGLNYLKVGNDSATSFDVSPFVRYYLNNGLFGQADLIYQDQGGVDDFRFGFSIGYSLEITENVRIEPIVPISFSPFSLGVGVGVQAYIFR